MKLVRVRVSNYKSVLDSEWFSVGDLTCLVGKNESGKTAVLEALEKIYAVRDERGSLLDTDYPRLNWSEYEESDAVDTAIETEWQLTDSELEHIQKLGQGAVLSKDHGRSLEGLRQCDAMASTFGLRARGPQHSRTCGPRWR